MNIETSELEGSDLAVYTADWCGDCRRLKRWLDEAGVSYRAVDIEAEPGAADRLERETGKRAIPFVLVNGGTWVRGYHADRPGRFDPRLLVDELRAAARGS